MQRPQMINPNLNNDQGEVEMGEIIAQNERQYTDFNGPMNTQPMFTEFEVQESRILPNNQRDSKSLEQSRKLRAEFRSSQIFQEHMTMYKSLMLGASHSARSVKTLCPECSKQVKTVMTRHIGKQTLIASCLLLTCSFGMLCMACMPCLIDDCKDVKHTCPECGKVLGGKKFQIMD